ncbi:MAG: hypothetical protein K2I20_04455 [Clostridia bacterium]|nr:hypothetical protein [Clostridia bacterium]
MAKKTTKTTKTTRRSTTERDIEKFCAFWAMAIAAILYIFSGIIALVIRYAAVANILNVVTLLGNIAMIVAIALPAYKYAVTKGKNGKIIYWILLVIFAFGVVMSFIGHI